MLLFDQAVENVGGVEMSRITRVAARGPPLQLLFPSPVHLPDRLEKLPALLAAPLRVAS